MRAEGINGAGLTTAGGEHRALMMLGLMVLLSSLVSPSLQFRLPSRDEWKWTGEATSAHGKPAGGDQQSGPYLQSQHDFPHPLLLQPSAPPTARLAEFPAPDSSLALRRAARLSALGGGQEAQTSKTRSKTNRFQPAQPLGPEPSSRTLLLQHGKAEISRQSQKSPATTSQSSLKLRGNNIPQRKLRIKHHSASSSSSSPSLSLPSKDNSSLSITEIVEVQLALHSDGKLWKQAPAKALTNLVSKDSTAGEAVSKAVLQEGDSAALQQEAGGWSSPSQTQSQTHAANMVLTAVGSVAALVGVTMLAAIFQCCCRRKRRGEEGQRGEGEKDPGKGGVTSPVSAASSSSRSQSRNGSRSSKSPSPTKTGVGEGEPAVKGEERDKLLEDDEELGDFSLVQRETEILRSYRKPPPPKNRARASRVPRALKAVEPNTSPTALQELIEQDETAGSVRQNQAPVNTTSTGPSEAAPDNMHSSMLADIDSTLAALHSDTKPDRASSLPKNAEQEKTPKTDIPVSPSDVNQLKPPTKDQVRKSASREEIAKMLNHELSKSLGPEPLPRSKPSSPKTPNRPALIPKSLSADASPKLGGKDAFLPKECANVEKSGTDVKASSGDSVSCEQQGGGNFFALIDPTVKENEGEDLDKGKSRIPVRAASSPTPPIAPLRKGSGKEKRFPVPSVHGEQMDQLLKSLKTRLKEDGTSPKKGSNQVSPSDESSDNDTDMQPKGRDRAHSDPNKKQDTSKSRPTQL